VSDKERRCGMCRKAPARPGYHVCATCLPNIPARQPVEDTLAAIDDSLAANTYLPPETP
jgi:hypothetical protein